MADSCSREEKLAAGLKKFKKFQQKSEKRMLKRRVKEPPPVASVSSAASSKGPDTEVPESQNEVPSLAQKYSNELEQSKTLSSSSTDVSESASENSIVERTIGSHPLSDSVPKSKSDQDLSSVKELSSAESLHQISLQVNGLMTETDAFLNGGASEVTADDQNDNLQSQSLEKRNQELAQMVSSLRQLSDQLQFQLQEQKAKLKRQSQSFERERQDLQERSHKEQVTLKDQLQVHIQTIGILVAEKTELQSSLSLSQQTAKQKAGEVEELQGRLRASRQRASDLERELISLSNSNQQHEKIKVETAKEIERLKLDNYKLNKANEEFKMSNVELTEKLNKKISELQALEKELSDCRSRLSSAQAQVDQLSSDSCSQNSGQLEEVYQQKFELEKRLSLHKESIDKLINERDQMSEQYQQYIQQLSQQVTSLGDEVRQLSHEKEELLKEKNSLKEVLEARPPIPKASDSQEENPELKLQINILKNQNEEMNQKLQTEVSNNSRLSEELEEKEERLSELEKSLRRLREEQVDQTRLAETMQSDKVAASRAVAQNRELKKQLEELEKGFVGMSNDKLELAERLHSEQHITKELSERLTQQEEELQELREQLSEKESELRGLLKSNTKGIYQQNQIADRMRHYEAQGQLVEMLQKELRQAQEQISELTSQNSELRMAVATRVEVAMGDECQKEDKDVSKRNDLVASLSASVRQLEMERNQLMKHLEEQKANRTNLEDRLKKKEIQLSEGVNGSDAVSISWEEYDQMKKAMVQLEERFKQTMERIAELSDERQQLEHLVTQLQGENDTIGDYIALYQIQRSLMRKRASEKDEYIAQLARDREDLKAKLTELQCLVMRLLEERRHFQSSAPEINDNDTLGWTKMAPHIEEEDNTTHRASSMNKETTTGESSLCDGHLLEKEHQGPLGVESEEREKKQATARKIMDLLTEIETTNLVEKPVLDSFHPCPVCSGRLITV